MLKGLGINYAILRPTLVFGDGDLLLNNMAWALRRFPVFPVWERATILSSPSTLKTLRFQAVEAGSQSENSVADAAGPDTFSFEELLRLLACVIGVRRWFVHTPPSVGLTLTRLVGLLMRDVDGLMARAAYIYGRTDRHYQAKRLPYRQRRRLRKTVRIRDTAQFPPAPSGKQKR